MDAPVGRPSTNAFYKRVEAVAEDARKRRAGEAALEVAEIAPPAPITYAMPPTADAGKKSKKDKPKKKKKKKKRCYLTTACVTRRGLSDDCVELETLRRFRDGYLLELPSGPALIEACYESAPEIVAAIDARPDAAEIYDGVYGIVCDCVDAIEDGRNEEALRAYTDMVVTMRAQHCASPEYPRELLAALAVPA